MTTIIVNENFLIADHRATTLVNRSGDHLTLDVSTGEKPTEVISDTRLKIEIPPVGRLLGKNGGYVEAYAFTGSATVSDTFKSIYEKTMPEPRLLYDVMMILSLAQNSRNCCIVAMMSDGSRERIEITATKYVNRYIHEGPGWTAIGSGHFAVDTVTKNTGQDSGLTGGDLMAFAAACDTSTSPSYSVYSREHKVLYACVNPGYAEHKESYRRCIRAMYEFDQPHYIPIRNCLA